MKHHYLFLLLIFFGWYHQISFGQKSEYFFPAHPHKYEGLDNEQLKLAKNLSSYLFYKYQSIVSELGNSLQTDSWDIYQDDFFQIDVNGRVRVEVGVPEINNEYKVQLLINGFEIVHELEKYHRYDGWLPISYLKDIASLPFISFIRNIELPVISNLVYTEGDSIHKSNYVRREWPTVDGDGIKIGVISDGVDHKDESIAVDELPTIDLVDNGSGDEGTAMLEIIYDISPSSDLAFAEAGNSEADMAANIDALVDAGCKIICDDVTYFHEPTFESGTIGSKITEVYNSDGIVYISSAGNYGERHHISDYYNNGDNWHRFPLNGGYSNYLTINIEQGETGKIILQWNDKYGQSGNDYDLYLYGENFGFLWSSTTNQNGNDDPYESISWHNYFASTTFHIAILNVDGLADSRKLNLLLSNASLDYDGQKEESSHWGHPIVQECLSTGAMWSFIGHLGLEDFSSQGPALIYSYDGSGNPTGFFERIKPDVIAMNDVDTYVGLQGNFPNPFQGTSAAAPHVAGLAGLIWSINTSMSNSTVRNYIEQNCFDITGYDPNKNNEVGEGGIDAVNSVLQILSPILPIVQITNPLNNATVEGTIDINVSASDNSANGYDDGVDSVEIYIDNDLLETKYELPYNSSWNTTTYSNGQYVIKAIAYDIVGASAEDNIIVTVDNTIPPGPYLTLTNTENIPNPVSYSGGTFFITVTNAGTGTLSWNTQDIPAWVTLNPTSGNTVTAQNVDVIIQSNTGSPRNCNIKFYNTEDLTNYQYLNIYQAEEPVSSAGWESFYKDPANRGYQDVSFNTNVGIQWTATSSIPLTTFRGPVVSGDKIVFASSSGIICYDINGNEIWSNTSFDANTFPAIYNDILYVADDQDNGEGKLFAMDLHTGFIYDESSGTAPYEGVIVADASGIYLVAEINYVYCYSFNGSSLSLEWYYSHYSQFGEHIEFRTSGPAIYGSYVYVNGVTADDYKLYGVRLNKSSGNYSSHFMITDPAYDIDICNTPVVDNSGRSYFTFDVGTTGVLRCYNSSFSSLWSYNSFTDDRITPPVYYNSKVYVGDDNGKVYCLNASNGSLVFANDNGSDIEKGMAVTNTCLVALRDNELNLLNLSNGSVIADISLSSTHYAPPAVIGNTIIAANQNEEIYCISNTFPPEADFSGSPLSGYANLNVSFSDQSTPGSSPISSWFWDFGDGDNSTLQNPSHTYTSPGLYTVSLTVTSSVGSDTYTRSDYINVWDTPQIIFIPTSHDYGNVYTGTCSDNYTFILKNNGGGSATGSVSSTNSSDFNLVSGGGNFSLSAGQTKDIIVQFCPSSSGSKSGSLFADGTPPCNDISASLSGNGVEPTISIISPDGFESWAQGSQHQITWSDNIAEDVKIELYKSGGVDHEIVASTPSDGSYPWTIPAAQAQGSDYSVKITSTTNSSVYDFSDNDFTISAQAPTITVSATSLPSFGNVQVGTNSPPQSYSVSGSNLSGNISVTAPSGFQVSLNSSSGYTTSLSLVPSGGTVNNTTIYTRFSPAAAQFYSGSISHSSSGATTKYVAVEGTGTNNYITLDPPLKNVSANAGNYSVDVFSNVSWTVSEACPWVSVTGGSGNNNGAFFVSYTQNTSGSPRSCTLTVSGEGTTAEHALNQSSGSVPVNQNLENITLISGQTDCYDATQNITVAGGGSYFVALNGSDVTMISGQNIIFSPETMIVAGSDLLAYITTNGLYCGAMSSSMVAADTASAGGKIIETESAFTRDETFRIYPNPTRGEFTLELAEVDPEVNTYLQVFNSIGMSVINEWLGDGTHHIFDLSNQQPGIYIVRLIRDEQVEVKKLIRSD